MMSPSTGSPTATYRLAVIQRAVRAASTPARTLRGELREQGGQELAPWKQSRYKIVDSMQAIYSDSQNGSDASRFNFGDVALVD